MKVLFICKSNQFRSQMAASLYNKFTGTNDATSAGTYVGTDTEPEGVVIETCFRTQDFFEFMEDKGINLRDKRTMKLLPEMMKEADVVVSMAEEPHIPDFLRMSDKVLWWDVENPAFATREVTERTYLQIGHLVKELIRSKG